jgi:hypothetical protein
VWVIIKQVLQVCLPPLHAMCCKELQEVGSNGMAGLTLLQCCILLLALL